MADLKILLPMEYWLPISEIPMGWREKIRMNETSDPDDWCSFRDGKVFILVFRGRFYAVPEPS